MQLIFWDVACPSYVYLQNTRIQMKIQKALEPIVMNRAWWYKYESYNIIVFFFQNDGITIKVHIFWEGHKIL